MFQAIYSPRMLLHKVNRILSFMSWCRQVFLKVADAADIRAPMVIITWWHPDMEIISP